MKSEKKVVSIIASNPVISLALSNSMEKEPTKDEISFSMMELKNQVDEDGLREELPTVKKM